MYLFYQKRGVYANELFRLVFRVYIYSTTSSNIFKEITIPSHIQMMVIAGENNRYANVNFVIAERQSPLRIVFVNFYWYYREEGISYSGNERIIFDVNGHCEMRGTYNVYSTAINIPVLTILGNQSNDAFILKAAATTRTDKPFSFNYIVWEAPFNKVPPGDERVQDKEPKQSVLVNIGVVDINRSISLKFHKEW